MVAAIGGSISGGCRPAGALAVDWVLGWGNVSFSGYIEDRSTLGRVSDHHFVAATATVGPASASRLALAQLADVLEHPRDELDGDVRDLGVGHRRHRAPRLEHRRAPSRSSRSPRTSNPRSRTKATASRPRRRHSSTWSGSGQ